MTVGETPKRLQPTQSTTREIYLKSGNECAFPGCRERILSTEGVLTGEIAHIRAAEPGGPRFDASMSNEQRRAAANLLLLCANHHKEVDQNLEKWTCQELKRIKGSHEAIYASAVDKLRESITDVTETDQIQYPQNLGVLVGNLRHDDEQLAGDIACVTDCFKRVAQLPMSTREVLAIIVNRGTTNMPWWASSAEVAISPHLLERLVSCDREELKGNLRVLIDAGFAWIDQGEGYELILLGHSTGGMGWSLFEDIHDRLANPDDGRTICSLFVDLKLTELDT